MEAKRFKTFEGSLRAKDQFKEFTERIKEHFKLGHVEPVPTDENVKDNYYLPMHAVQKDSSTTTKIRVVFDGSVKSTLESSLNDQFLLGPTVYASSLDVLTCFRHHKVAMETDVRKMHRAVLLSG